jgi:hypothetical protein
MIAMFIEYFEIQPNLFRFMNKVYELDAQDTDISW